MTPLLNIKRVQGRLSVSFLLTFLLAALGLFYANFLVVDCVISIIFLWPVSYLVIALFSAVLESSSAASPQPTKAADRLRPQSQNVIQFLVQGSEPQPYLVTFTRHTKGLYAQCTCAAAEKGWACKHRLRILEMDKQNMAIVGGDREDLKTVWRWYHNSTLWTVVRDLRFFEEHNAVVGDYEDRQNWKKEQVKLRSRISKLMTPRDLR